MENIYVIQPTHRGRARIIALILAVILYLIFLAPLILELKPVLSQKYNDYFPPQSSGKLSQTPGLPPRTTPAPVRYMPLPPAPQPQALAMPAQSQQAQTAVQQQTPQESQKQESAQLQQQKTTPPSAEKELPKIPERMIQQEQRPQTTQPKAESQRAHGNNAAETDPHAPFLRRRLREKCYKNGRIPEQISTLNTQAQRAYPSAGAQLAQGFSEHMYQQQSFEEATALTSTHNTQGHDSALEAQLFMHTFGMTFCNNSYNEPLKMHTSLIQPHRIELMITCNKQRKVTRVRFIKTSYDQAINDYIKELLENMLTPQIPASVVTSEVTFPISIELERVYQSNVIYFVPGNSKRRGY
jgi:hypothetical protein